MRQIVVENSALAFVLFTLEMLLILDKSALNDI